MGLLERTKNAWNAFRGREPTVHYDYGASSFARPDRQRFSHGNERSIVNAILNRIALDAAAIDLKYIKCDEDDNFDEELTKTGLDQCLTVEANIDQTARDFRHDIYLSLFDDGDIAIVPTDVSINPYTSEAYDILTMRTGKIVEWYPHHVKVKVYNDNKGKYEFITVSKETVGIVHNPFYTVMNEPSSTYKRLVRKLNLLDYIDEQSGSGKLDLIIQLPYAVHDGARKNRADARRQDLENQLSNSKFGVAWIDATEHITQINRAVENNLLTQIENLTKQVYTELGVDETVINGTANEETMLNYQNRVIEVVVSAVVDEMKRKFITKAARTQHKTIMYTHDPFRLMPVSQIAEIGDKMRRNEIMNSNELRTKLGLKPSKDPKANQIINPNLSQPKESANNPQQTDPDDMTQEGENQNDY